MITSPNKKNMAAEFHNSLAPQVMAGAGLLALALKNYILYPETNGILIQSLGNLNKWLFKFLQENEFLRLTVEKDHLLFFNDVVHRDKADEQSLAAPLFRDGIQWFEFWDGLTFEELRIFINLLGRFRLLKEEAEDDLATCLWEADLPHIRHKTANEFWETDPLPELDALKAIIEHSDDAKALEVASHIEAGSKSIGLALQTFNKEEKKFQRIKPKANAAACGLPPRDGQSLKAEEKSDQGSEGAPGSGPNGGGNSGRPAPEIYESQNSQAFLPFVESEETEHELSIAFSALLNDLAKHPASSPPKLKRPNPSGAVAMEGDQKPEREKPLMSYLDLPDYETGQSPRRDKGILHSPGEHSPSDSNSPLEENASKLASCFASQVVSPFWKLSPTEQEQLKNLISQEEKRDNTSDCLSIIQIMLESLETRADRLVAVDFIAEEAKCALRRGGIGLFQAFMERLNSRARAAAQGDWATDFLSVLKKKLGSPDVLDTLGEAIDEGALTDNHLAELKNFLFLLPPDTLYTLVDIIPKIKSRRLEKAILSVVAVEACHLNTDTSPMISRLKNALILDLIHIIKTSDLPLPTASMAGLTRNESQLIRKEAARLLLSSNPGILQQLSHLIDDPDLGINSLLCSHMGRRQNPLSERILLKHLDKSYRQARQDHSKAHLLNCYRALGLCASASAIVFLQDVLMRKNWKSFLGLEGNWHGVGAALALMLMPQQWGTRDILHKTAKSRFRNIRLAYEEAQKELPLSWKMSEDD